MNPYDLFKVAPASYNLTIERDGGEGRDKELDKAKTKEQKRKELMDKKAGGASIDDGD